VTLQFIFQKSIVISATIVTAAAFAPVSTVASTTAFFTAAQSTLELAANEQWTCSVTDTGEDGSSFAGVGTSKSEAVSDLRSNCYEYKKGYLKGPIAWANCIALASVSSCSKSN
jgi:hypothetical protein